MVSPIRKRIKVKIISEYKELEGQTFNTVQECTDAEAKIEERRAEIASNEKLSVTKRKKELAKAISNADAAVQKAYQDYETAKATVRKILEESNEQMMNIINPAKEAITNAEKLRMDAILAYTKEFGSYQSVYTGERAVEEFNRATRPAISFADIIKAFI